LNFPAAVPILPVVPRLRLVLLLLWASGVSLPALAYEAVPVSDGGTLAGSVRFRGTPPALEPIPVRKNQEACGTSVPNEALVLGPGGGVRGAVILVEGVRRGKPPEGELMLDNVRCLFVPHVAAVMAGAPVRVKSSDGVLHNAHGQLAGRTIFNTALSRGRVVDLTAKLRQPGLVRVLCDAHAHMVAWIVVHDSPYAAVTDEAGAFRIEGIPPGTYRVTLWHEGYQPRGTDKDGRPLYEERRLSRDVTVPRGGTVTIDFELR
jgi:hypothetical protein